MIQGEHPESFCKSVFKSGENTVLQKQFTIKWIELINRLEKRKGLSADHR